MNAGGTVQASSYGHTTEIDSDNPFIVKKQPKKCRDPLFAVLLWANVAVVVGLFIKFGMPADEEADVEDEEIAEYSGIVKISIGTAAAAAVLSGAMLQVLLCIPELLIKVAVLFNVAMAALVAVYGFYIGQTIVGVVGLIFLALMICYAYAVWSRIPFATANLRTATTAVRANCSVSFIAYFFTALAFAWFVLWSLALAAIQKDVLGCVEQDGVTVCENLNYGVMFLLFVSLFFTAEVLKNCTHVTVSGVVASWWFEPQNNGFCGASVLGSFLRTITTSFGSICFGSLLVAIIQAVRQLVEMAKQNEDLGSTLACCIDCILGCLESLLEYFNKWAFVYVGVYGYGYCEAGKSVMQLFKDRGWEAVIADDLVGMVLFMMSLIVGAITGGIGVLLVRSTEWLANADGIGDTDILAFIIGIVLGLLICSILMGVIASAVNTTIVLFADAPAEFEKHYPELSNEMREAYSAAHPGSI
jgi:hypothetical protein